MIIQISLIFVIVLNDIIVKNIDKYSKMLIFNNDRYLSILISEMITMYRYLLVIDRTFCYICKYFDSNENQTKFDENKKPN